VTRRKLVVGNWKMHGSRSANAPLLSGILESRPYTCDVAVCPPFPYLSEAAVALASSGLRWGGQDCSVHEQGAYTGEVSARMLAEFGCRYVIVGHSERRALHAESDGLVAEKAKAALAHGVTPIVCVGETLAERESGQTESVVKRSGGQTVGSGPISSRIKTPVTETTELGHAATRPESVKQAIDSLETRITSAYRRGDAEAAEAFKELKGAIEGLRTRGLPPEVASEAAAINKAYATFMQLQRATGSLGAQTQGVTTPRQMLSAVKANDRSPGKSAFARGNALNQADVLRAEQVLGSRLPETGPGTAEKLLPVLGFGLPMVGMDMGATALLGTQTGQRFLQGALPGQAAVRRYGNEYLVPALRAYGMTQGN